ncbi:bifunctional [glutamate--ammonia ligase]-adenylyl-L-tyrosine phosphorylase/[glutamate--ammonia-ligase] adenylyltransferase [Aurantivibrio plasticivorans]
MLVSDSIPSVFHSQLEQFESQWRSVENEEVRQSVTDGLSQTRRRQLSRCVVGSEFFSSTCLSKPHSLRDLLFCKVLPLEVVSTYSSVQAFLKMFTENADSDVALDKALRAARRQFMLRTIWRDLNRMNSMEQTTNELSWFANAAISTAADFHYRALVKQHGLPVSKKGEVQPFLVLGMGKLGAFELNLSSDIDLIFAFPEAGETVSTVPQRQKLLTNQEFFIRLGQRVIKSLDVLDANGFVFRVDMRLRPWGQSGPLATNFDFLENYYQTQGREWERFAMIKARVVAMTDDALLQQLANEPVNDVTCRAGKEYANQLSSMLLPFTYRKYLDYSAIDAMRSMKALINKEVARKGLKENIKLGAGGIREVEFIVQVFQLIRGGRDTHLQERRLQSVLPLLVEDGCLPVGMDQQLSDAYVFLRNTEHVIQAFQDRQTQQLPVDDIDQFRLAWLMGFDDVDAFFNDLDRHRELIHQQFQQVIAEEKSDEHAPQLAPEWSLIWRHSLDDNASVNFLATQGMLEAESVVVTLNALRESRPVLSMQAAARERLDSLMPVLLEDLCGVEHPDETLKRICLVLEAVARRSAYIVLLLENPSARRQLTTLCAASPWIANQLAKYPALLDELLDVRVLYSPPDMAVLQDELRRQVLRLSWHDLESHMETLRHFRLSHGLRVAACEVVGVLPLMKVSDYLSNLAEVVLRHVLELAWQQMVSRYGQPSKAVSELSRPGSQEVDPKDFVILAYGKLGGIELGHGSDLDLVFVHDADPMLTTDGPKEIDNATFFTRLGQKIIHILNTRTISGQLYEVDMRLRPSGNSGLLVSSLSAFEKYQRHNAWVWEHQALLRARVVAGNAEVKERFRALRHAILCETRDIAELKSKVVSMREKMRKQLAATPSDQADKFHLKHGPGGIVDIEFMVQYAVLAWAHQHPALTEFTDNIRILGALEEARLVSAEHGTQLIEAYKTYRSAVHRLALQGQPNVVDGDHFVAERKAVLAIWESLFGDAEIRDELN